MFATERMYELAFQFKGAKLWQQLYDDEVFAVKLSDGEIGYCSVMGKMGDHFALGLYIGDEGYQSYRLLLDADHESLDDAAMGNLMTSQSCLQCSFENKDMLSDEELDEVRHYAREHEKPLRGKNAFPQFTKYQTGRFPWRFRKSEEEAQICDALSAAIALKKMLCQYSKGELGLCSLREEPQKIPMLAYEGGRWIIKYTKLPSSAMRYPELQFTNEVMAARLKRKKKTGIWECGTMRLPTAVQEEGHEEEAPYYPLALVYVELGAELLQQPIVTDGEDSAEMMNDFAAQMLGGDSLPQILYCRDDRCFALLKDLCDKAGIQIERTDKMEALDGVLQELLEHMAGDEDSLSEEEELTQLIEALSQMSDNELRSAPPEIVNLLYSLAEAEALPDELSERIKKLFRRKR